MQSLNPWHASRLGIMSSYKRAHLSKESLSMCVTWDSSNFTNCLLHLKLIGYIICRRGRYKSVARKQGLGYNILYVPLISYFEKLIYWISCNEGQKICSNTQFSNIDLDVDYSSSAYKYLKSLRFANALSSYVLCYKKDFFCRKN